MTAAQKWKALKESVKLKMAYASDEMYRNSVQYGRACAYQSVLREMSRLSRRPTRTRTRR